LPKAIEERQELIGGVVRQHDCQALHITFPFLGLHSANRHSLHPSPAYHVTRRR
jgi:hypothetical protein